ncbi:electron transport complex subunit RsxG [Paraglaciecola hydrolytica]|uniref:Ion-translocating oxidoreductase complex subunit G n=1 Tax=Paraglaciecola hydrolytica TaxID=1799789 RepID=A0A136A0B4_9ALTE|nr:electron transport complex subunit RsxG [Paraglaciecola hydrolytica]KXI28652.1 electron transport complex subunit G [Paraglaciecola hydrolytica]
MTKSIFNKGLILAAFAMVTSGLIGLTYFGTKEQIAHQQQQKLQAILNAIIDPSSYNNAIANNCALMTSAEYLGSNEPQHIYRALNNEQAVAVAIETTAPDGYSGKIQIVVGLNDDADGNVMISGVRVLDHKETPGLGDKIDLRVNDWVLSFAQRIFNAESAPRFAVKKDGGQFDQFTGATISPRAVVKAVKRSAEFYQLHKNDIFAAANACSLDASPVNSASSKAD